jgi:hypothetical protein
MSNENSVASFCDLFNDVVSKFDCIVQNDWLLVNNDVKWNGRGLNDSIQAFA